MKWVLFRYENGGNPYIAKTEKEVKRMLNKYKNNIRKVSDTYYYIYEPMQPSLFWWND